MKSQYEKFEPSKKGSYTANLVISINGHAVKFTFNQFQPITPATILTAAKATRALELRMRAAGSKSCR